jgi:hypothetical protein
MPRSTPPHAVLARDLAAARRMLEISLTRNVEQAPSRRMDIAVERRWISLKIAPSRGSRRP